MAVPAWESANVVHLQHCSKETHEITHQKEDEDGLTDGQPHQKALKGKHEGKTGVAAKVRAAHASIHFSDSSQRQMLP